MRLLIMILRKTSLVALLLFTVAFTTKSAPAYPVPAQNPLPLVNNANPQSDYSDVISSSPLLSLHRLLVEIESITYNENAVGSILHSFLEAHNFTVETQGVHQPEHNGKKRFNIYAYPSTGGSNNVSEPKTLLSTHIDTVPPFIPYTVKPSGQTLGTSTKDLIIAGRGSVDAKACVATQIYALLSLLSTSSVSASDVNLLFVVGEEYGGDGMTTFSNSPYNDPNRSGAATWSTIIFGEPTELKLAAGHKGILLVKITAHGKAAHSGYPWLGLCANSMLIPALVVLDQLGELDVREGGLPRSSKYGKSTVNVGLIRGGVAANVVPESAYAEVLIRLAGGTAEEAKRIVTRAVKAVDERLEVDFNQGYGPVDIDTDVPGFESMTVNYGTDIPNLKVKESVKRYLYGPGSILVAHSDHEELTVGDLEDAVEGYKKLILASLEKEGQ